VAEASIDFSRSSKAPLGSLDRLIVPYTDYSGDKAKAFGDFESAIQINANDPDIYYHREMKVSSSSLDFS
jgi:hypothetical protein